MVAPAPGDVMAPALGQRDCRTLAAPPIEPGVDENRR